MNRLIAACLMFVVALAIVLVPMTASAAFNPLGSVDCAKARDSAVCQTRAGDPLTGREGVILRVTRLVAVLAGIVAVFVLVFAGIRYIASGGDANQVSQAKKTIIFAAVGLVVIVLGQAIITYLITRI